MSDRIGNDFDGAFQGCRHETESIPRGSLIGPNITFKGDLPHLFGTSYAGEGRSGGISPRPWNSARLKSLRSSVTSRTRAWSRRFPGIDEGDAAVLEATGVARDHACGLGARHRCDHEIDGRCRSARAPTGSEEVGVSDRRFRIEG